MTKSNLLRVFVVLLAVFSSAPIASAQIDARMLRYPAVSKGQIAFVYAGDIWLVPKTGGTAVRLSSPPGEEVFPRFSPDGTKIAYSASYDGNTDVYVIPAQGGEPVRLTHHPMADRVIGWTPDGTRVLFASGRESGRQRFSQFFTVGTGGGLPEKLPVPYGEFGTYSPDGAQFVYMPMSQDFRNWKRYRGGWAPDLLLFNLKTFATKNITANPANDAQPMWHGNTIYFLSDRGANERNNIWAYDVGAGRVRQVTHLADFDITFPSLGPDGIVFQAGGRLYFLDLATEKTAEVPVHVVTDETTLRPRIAKVEPLVQNVAVSPAGKRAVFEARGDVLTVPAEYGAVVNVTRSSGVAERYPRWSPDGKTVAYWSDRSGEYELTLRPADGSGPEKKVTSLGAGFRYPPQWSPDSRKLAFIDQAMRIHIQDLDANRATQIDQSPEWIAHGGLAGFRFQWSPDSRWVTYARPTASANSAVFLYDTKAARLHQATTGYLNDTQPAFEPEGKYLYYASDREFQPVYGSFDNSWTYPNPTRLVAVPLRKDVKSPLAARNDAENPALDTDNKPADKPADKPAEKTARPADKDQKEEPKKPEEKKEEARPPAPPNVDIDVDGFESRAIVLPPKAGNYGSLQAIKGKLLYRRQPRTGSGDDKSPIVYFDLAEREEKTVLDDSDDFEVTFDGKKMLVASKRKFAILDIKAAQKFEKPMATLDMEAPVDPRAEWRQIFTDVFRFERDFFYDPNMHGVDWPGLRARYGRLLEDAVTRWDVDVLIGEFIGELNASHTYHGGGDMESAPQRSVGLLGVDWELSNGAYRIKRIVHGGPWDVAVRSPLDEPGVNVTAGEYVLAVNGVPIDAKSDPWTAFQGLGDKTVVLTVGSTPSAANARQVVVKCLSSEVELRFRDWIEERRQIVDKATGGKVGYIYVQSTGVDAQNELVRQFMAQWKKDGLIIDERWNSGGQIPDRFIELLNRPMLAYWAVRDGASQQWPPVAHRGPQVMLINGWSGSGGDAFPTYFREAGLGPLIGTRTWGGLIGISGAPALADGGSVTVPTFRMYDPKGQWFAEGHGVEPDIAVEDDPAQLAKGTDPQLQRAIKEVMERVAAAPKPPARPAYETRVPKGGGSGR
ncbi:MAG: peptidase S41 [Acidobacteria bacterium RIFCSPLOWO2_02_FULL_67_36]|nr:MAG: peptidase S41 [Acidobacteria bacterium RIFCSPLOWO2_02_FULL_67_36]